MKNEELVNLKGDYDGYLVHDFCSDFSYCICCDTSAQGGITMCQEESGFAVLDSWVAFWATAGYSVECNRVIWAK